MDLQVPDVSRQIGPIAFDWSGEERFHLAVGFLAKPKDLALADNRYAHGLHEVIDGSRRVALNVGLLNDLGQSLLGHALRLERVREVAAFQQLRNA